SARPFGYGVNARRSLTAGLPAPPVLPPPPGTMPTPPIMAPPSPIRIGAVISPIVRPPVAGPSITNEYGLFQCTGGPFREPQLARRCDRHSCSIFRGFANSEPGHNCGCRNDRFTHGFSSLYSGTNRRMRGVAYAT